MGTLGPGGQSLPTKTKMLLATCGTSVPDWLPRALAFKQVILGHDNDVPDQLGERPGDVAAMKAAPVFRSFGAIVERWRPALQDWNDVLMQYGREILRRELADDQVDDVEQPAPTAAAQDIEDAQPDTGGANHHFLAIPREQAGLSVDRFPRSGCSHVACASGERSVGRSSLRTHLCHSKSVRRPPAAGWRSC